MGHNWRSGIWLTTAVMCCCWMCITAEAGMPSPLPTSWTASNDSHVDHSSSGTTLRVQAISFFVAGLLLCGWLVKRLWNLARSDFPRLPLMTYGRALGLVLLWGLSFVIVLTMISGARELMTPGAWRKQGWTYQLAETSRPNAESDRAARQRQLEQLRTALWQFAATHDGRLPTIEDSNVDAALWQIPGFPGLKFLAVSDCKAEATGRLFVFEPDLEGSDRMVLLTNGFIGSMNSAAIKQALSEVRQANENASQGVVR